MLPAMPVTRERASDTAAGAGPGAIARPVDQGGRPLGPRAVATRGRLLAATHALLDERPVREVSVVEIARRAGTSPATFYQYFRDVEEATLELAREAAAAVPGALEPLRADWRGEGGLDAARALVRAFVRRWDAHKAVLLFTNVAAEQGDRRFRKVRTEAMFPLIEALAAKLATARAEADGARLHPAAAAAALAAILERLAAYHQELEAIGVARDDLVETVARIVHRTVTGGAEP
jgi:AcrR family transcriptional regulator